MIALLARALTTHALIGHPPHGDHEYHLWAIGTGYLHAHPTLLRTPLP